MLFTRQTLEPSHAKREWDTINSFYKWKIYLDNGKEFPGYSKRLNKPEVHCKIKLIQRCLIRLKKPIKSNPSATIGYFTPGLCTKLELYRRTGLGEHKEKLATLTPTHFELHNNQNFNENQGIQRFLNTFYTMIKAGTIGQLDYSDIGYSKVDEDKIFSLSAGRFRSIPDLQKFGNDLMIDGFTYERVKHFLRQYVEANLSF